MQSNPHVFKKQTKQPHLRVKYLSPKKPIKAIQYHKEGTTSAIIILSLLGLDSSLYRIATLDNVIFIDDISLNEGDWVCDDNGYLEIITDSVIQEYYNVADNWDTGGFW